MRICMSHSHCVLRRVCGSPRDQMCSHDMMLEASLPCTQTQHISISVINPASASYHSFYLIIYHFFVHCFKVICTAFSACLSPFMPPCLLSCMCRSYLFNFSYLAVRPSLAHTPHLFCHPHRATALPPYSRSAEWLFDLCASAQWFVYLRSLLQLHVRARLQSRRTVGSK